MRKRVVITGLGVVSAVGNSLPEFWDSLIHGKDGTKEITAFDPTLYRTKIAAEVSGLDPGAHFSKKEVHRLSRCDQFGIIAFREAWKGARLDQSPINKDRVGVVLGAGSGGILSVERYFRNFYKGLGKLSPALLVSYSLATTTDLIAIESGLKGPRNTTATVCSSSSVSMGVAYEMIQMGMADVMVSGGSDSLCEVSFSGFSSLKLVDPESCKPFDKRRQGLVIGEGAGILILEELEHAMRRRAPIFAEILGYGICAEGDQTCVRSCRSDSRRGGYNQCPWHCHFFQRCCGNARDQEGIGGEGERDSHQWDQIDGGALPWLSGWN
jgi:3-oxoacyl-[acyl-carrier-protein] synthase II